MASYYERVADWMLPHVKGRPVSMQRFPDGIDGKGFFHKDIPDYFPDWIKRVEVPKANGTVTHVVISTAATLVYLVGQNTITPHVWLSRADRVWQPDRLVIDLDPPPGGDFAAVRRAARWSGELLRDLGLAPFAQVTGSKGIHVWTPLRRRARFEDVHELARDIGRVLAADHPDELTTEFRKANRGERILVDTARNGYAQTTVPPYAVRPRPGRARGHADRVGGAVRLQAPPRPLERDERPATTEREGRPLGRHRLLRPRHLPRTPTHRLAATRALRRSPRRGAACARACPPSPPRRGAP